MQLKHAMLATGLVAAALCSPVAAQETGGADSAAAEAYTFRLALSQGDKFAFRQTMDMNQDLDIAGQQISTVMSMTSDYSYEVMSVAESGDMSVKIQFGRIKGSFENPMMGGAIEFDSDVEAEESGNPMMDMMQKAFTANAGHTLTLVLTPTGDVVSIDGIDEMVDRMLEDNPMAAMGGLDAESLKDQMKDNFEGQLGQIPAEPVAVGDTWSNDRGMNGMGGMGMQMTIKSTLSALSADEAVVDSDISGELSGGQMAAMLQVEDFSGKSKTTLSRKDGLVLSSTADVNMTATMDAGPQGQGAMVMSITTKLERIPVTASAPETPAETPSEGGGEK